MKRRMEFAKGMNVGVCFIEGWQLDESGTLYPWVYCLCAGETPEKAIYNYNIKVGLVCSRVCIQDERIVDQLRDLHGSTDMVLINFEGLMMGR